jgi:hypothetical protein
MQQFQRYFKTVMFYWTIYTITISTYFRNHEVILKSMQLHKLVHYTSWRDLSTGMTATDVISQILKLAKIIVKQIFYTCNCN